MNNDPHHAGICRATLVAQRGGWLANFNEDRGDILLGFVGGLLAHELGHISAATLKGTDIQLEGLAITYPDSDISDRDRLQLASAGFLVQWFSSEIAFHYLQKDDASASAVNRAKGVIASHLAITAAYVTFLKHHPDGDIEGMAKASNVSHDRLALAVAIPAILDGWRLFRNRVPKWVPLISPITKGAGIVWVWTY